MLKPSCAAASQTQSSLEEEGERVLQVGAWGGTGRGVWGKGRC